MPSSRKLTKSLEGKLKKPTISNENIFPSTGSKTMTQNLRNARNLNELLELKYGQVGQPARDDFEKKSQLFIIAELLKAARKEAQLTQKQLADKVGTHKSYISRLENGRVDIPLSTLCRVFEQGLGRKIRIDLG
jgi:DNA-binding XRE family transcriptional regulator